MRTEDIRDDQGKLTGVRIFEVDALGREQSTDAPLSVAVGIDHSSVVEAVRAQMTAAVQAKSSPALNAIMVLAIARTKGSKR